MSELPSILRRLWGAPLVVALAFGPWSCREIEFVFQPDIDRQGTHVRFDVQTPSKADILFVIDNSGSMREEQNALKRSIGQMLEQLAPRDTSYRIGIISTDTLGAQNDCCNIAIPTVGSDGVQGGNRGNCQACDCVGDEIVPGDPSMGFYEQCIECPDPDMGGPEVAPCADPDGAGPMLPAGPDVGIRRPHDGARGRLIAAYDPDVFRRDAVDSEGNRLYVDDDGNPLPSQVLDALEMAFPTGLREGPVGFAGQQGVRWVIDREAVRQDACTACGCAPCDPNSEDPTVQACFDQCAAPVARSLVTAYFNSNINGLGTSGFGHEAGIQAAMLAVGIDGTIPDDAGALDPPTNLTDPNLSEPNTITTLDPTGRQIQTSWLRDDALLAIMFVSDEEDCSMPKFLLDLRVTFEGNAMPPQPVGSMCYQEQVQTQFLRPSRLADLAKTLKGSASRVAVGFIGGVEKSGPALNPRRDGTPRDCVSTIVASEDQEPDTACSCLTGAETEPAWCNYTIDQSGTGPTCDALAGNRYVDFTSEFTRRTFDSVCREGPLAFGEALRDFAEIATLACFDLEGVTPANADPNNLEVQRLPRDDVGTNAPLQLLPQLDEDAAIPDGGGWIYDQGQNQVCLLGLDRLIGDRYDIFILFRDELDFSR